MIRTHERLAKRYYRDAFRSDRKGNYHDGKLSFDKAVWHEQEARKLRNAIQWLTLKQILIKAGL